MHLLIVDDEASLRDFLTIVFEEEGWTVTCAGSVAEGTAALCEIDPDIVLCDLMMPDGSGLEILKLVNQQHENVPVVMITAYTSAQSAVAALKAGAYDYLSKPFDVDELKIVLEKAVERRELEHENVYLRQALEERFTFSSIIGKSRRMQEIFRIIERIARTTSTVLITGESGTGKEMVARAIHAHSKQPGRFVSVNCGALPENLLESELFGHEKGAFTGAIREKKGLFQEADRGTLFLDEIGEMSSAVQIKLLRVLQERTIRKVGRQCRDSCECPHHRCDESGSRRVDRRRGVQRGSLLPDQRHPDRASSAARAKRRHSDHGRAFHRKVLEADELTSEESVRRCNGGDRELLVAWQRS